MNDELRIIPDKDYFAVLLDEEEFFNDWNSISSSSQEVKENA